jgi:hypothetical protein
VQADAASGFRHGDQIGDGQRLNFSAHDRHYADPLLQEDGGATEEWAVISASTGHRLALIAISSRLGNQLSRLSQQASDLSRLMPGRSAPITTNPPEAHHPERHLW